LKNRRNPFNRQDDRFGKVVATAFNAQKLQEFPKLAKLPVRLQVSLTDFPASRT
jgi:hypothetical protein